MKRRDFVDTLIKSAKENADTELEIVRCKDCRYYVENGLLDSVCTNWSSSTNRNSFCSFAVKIDKNEKDFVRLNHGRRKKRKKRNCKHYMYHVTERPYLDSIIANGEGLNRTAHRKRLGIYLCSKPSNWVDSFKEPAVIKVDLEGLNCFMSAFPENDELIVWGDIPVERLTVVDPVDWNKEGKNNEK